MHWQKAVNQITKHKNSKRKKNDETQHTQTKQQHTQTQIQKQINQDKTNNTRTNKRRIKTPTNTRHIFFCGFLLYKSPRGHQVDGLPRASNLISFRNRSQRFCPWVSWASFGWLDFEIFFYFSTQRLRTNFRKFRLFYKNFFLRFFCSPLKKRKTRVFCFLFLFLKHFFENFKFLNIFLWFFWYFFYSRDFLFVNFWN